MLRLMSSPRGSRFKRDFSLQLPIAWIKRILRAPRADTRMRSKHAGENCEPVQSQNEAKSSSSRGVVTAAHTLQQISRQSNENASSAGRAQSHREASFLGIPGELRNLIYRYALLQISMIPVSPFNPSQPALLFTSRQVRSEALPIWLTENTFKVDAWDMQLTIPSNYHDHWLSRVAYQNFFITMRGKKNWGNLKGWLARYARHEVPGLASGQPTDEAEILAQAFELVHCLLRRFEFEHMSGVLDAWVKTAELAGVEFDFQ